MEPHTREHDQSRESGSGSRQPENQNRYFSAGTRAEAAKHTTGPAATTIITTARPRHVCLRSKGAVRAHHQPASPSDMAHRVRSTDPVSRLTLAGCLLILKPTLLPRALLDPQFLIPCSPRDETEDGNATAHRPQQSARRPHQRQASSLGIHAPGASNPLLPC